MIKQPEKIRVLKYDIEIYNVKGELAQERTVLSSELRYIIDELCDASVLGLDWAACIYVKREELEEGEFDA